jgi:hypothetical protein
MNVKKTPVVIDISNWLYDDEYDSIYPKGARDKKAIISPHVCKYSHLLKNHRYLLKKSSHRYPDQFWIEIIAHQLGCLMNIPVPPSFAAIDNDGQVGALIEWFYDDKDPDFIEYIDGGDLIMGYIPDFDRKKGEKHNLITIIEIMKSLTDNQHYLCSDNWKYYWAKVFVFDAVIGNTDRHQDNWGICLYKDKDHSNKTMVKLSPVFDNGTSMGHEILEKNIHQFENHSKIKRYIQKGTHHMKWRINDRSRMNHVDFLCKYIQDYPETKSTIMTSLQFDLNHFKNLLNSLRLFNVPVILTHNKISLIFNLIKYRRELILKRIGG